MHLNRHSPYSPWLKRRCAPCHHQVNFSVSIANQNICCPCWSLRALGPCKALRRVYTAQTAEAFTAIDCSKSIPLTGACCVQVPAHLQCCSLRLITKVPNLQGRDGAGWLHWDAGRDPVQGLQAHLRGSCRERQERLRAAGKFPSSSLSPSCCCMHPICVFSNQGPPR